jgi:hypothetical protein
MKPGAKNILSLCAIIGAALVLAYFLIRAIDAQRNGWFSRTSVLLVIGTAALSFLGCVAYWYMPLGRRPHQVPMWNDIHHRRGLRALSASKYSLLCMVLGASIAFMVLSALLPRSNAPITKIIRGSTVDRPNSNGGKYCGTALTIRDGPIPSLCVCRLEGCLRGYTDDLRSGQPIGLAVSSNWAGSVVVGVVPDDA